MITAKEANFQSHNGAVIKNILAEVEKKIKAAIDDGRYECTVSITTDTKKEIRERIKDTLTALGYTVEITDYDKQYGNAPAEQRPWYDNITVSWEEII